MQDSLCFTTTYSSPLGDITMAGNGQALTGLWFSGQKYFGAQLPEETVPGDTPIFEQTKVWLDCYFRGQQPESLPPMAATGSPFQKIVWDLLGQIPYGTCTTYGALAKLVAQRLGRATMSAQAVGGAVGRNPISILIPCHRVIGTNGSLTGYAGGLERKLFLLRLEGVDTARLSRPKEAF